jgi:hypothetical protein
LGNLVKPLGVNRLSYFGHSCTSLFDSAVGREARKHCEKGECAQGPVKRRYGSRKGRD